MQEARKLQQELTKKQTLPSPRPAKSPNNSNQTSVHSAEEDPFLVIDINIGDAIEQLVIYKRDLGKEPALAREFALVHKIDEAGEERLAQLLR